MSSSGNVSATEDSWDTSLASQRADELIIVPPTIMRIFNDDCIYSYTNFWSSQLVKAGVFYKPEDCVETVIRLCENQGIPRGSLPATLPAAVISELNKELKGLKLKVTHINHNIACSGISKETAKTHRFDDGGQMTTVDQYFGKKYKINLRFKDWPLVMKGRKESARYFPLEVCKIAEKQRVANKRITEQEQAKVVKKTVVPPEHRQRMIHETLAGIKMREDEHLLKYGVSVNMKPLEPKGRVLDPPQLQYKESAPVRPKHGSWNMATNRVYKAGDRVLQKLLVLSMASPRFCPIDIIRHYCSSLGKHANGMGLRVEIDMSYLSSHIYYANARSNTWFDQMEKVFNDAKNKVQMILVIMDGQNKEIYGAVKRFGEQSCDILTQCVQVKKVKDVVNQPGRNAGVLSNMCLKINAKMGGTNVGLVMSPLLKELFHAPILFIGADVSHPDPGDKLSPSIVGVASSLDNIPGRYLGIEQLQAHRKECIVDLKGAVKAALIEYFKKTGKLKPVRIIFYRDGVSEGQFTEVLQSEMVSIQEACTELQEDYKPARTFIVVQKRHNTRLFLKNQPINARPADKNIPPGTTVDTDIVHPEEFDFYLSSHEGIQGTSKPTHYHVLYDDNRLDSNRLQQLTYYLCHTYARCTRSVSLPAPVYYAHLIAFRARMRLKSVFDSDQSRSDNTELTPEELKNLSDRIKVAKATQEVMYWQ